MRPPAVRACFSVLLIFLAPLGIEGSLLMRDLHVSPGGTAAGPGTMAAPYDLATALAGEVARPGDTFWLRGGDYRLGQIATRIEGQPGRPITFRQMPGEHARVDGSLIFFKSGGHVVLRDFELFSSDTNRLSAQTHVGLYPTDINPVIGIECHVPNFSAINLVVHDHTRSGIYISEISTNSLVYGCVVYNNGWASPDNAEGHSIYVQSHLGTREISDNVAFNAAGANFHIYEARGGGRLAGVTLDGNVAFQAGALQRVRRYHDWIIGVDPPAVSADRIILKDNLSYFPPASTAFDDVPIGRSGVNGSVVLLNNYFPQSLTMNNWTIAAVGGNVFATRTTNPIVRLNQTEVPLTAVWDDNRYWRGPAGGDFWSNSVVHGFPEWQAATGYDRNSTYTVAELIGTEVFVRPNRFEPGRANIVVYNWDNLSHVPIEVGSVLPVGAAYEVINAQDPFAPPVLSGVFDRKPLLLPMTGLTVAAPNGPLLTPAPTGPTFNVFLLVPRTVRLQIDHVDGTVQISWPTNAGDWVLQCTSASGWEEDGSVPAVLGDQYVVTKPATAQVEFYRLRPGV